MLRDKIRCMQETKEIKQGGPITMWGVRIKIKEMGLKENRGAFGLQDSIRAVWLKSDSPRLNHVSGIRGLRMEIRRFRSEGAWQSHTLTRTRSERAIYEGCRFLGCSFALFVSLSSLIPLKFLSSLFSLCLTVFFFFVQLYGFLKKKPAESNYPARWLAD